MTELVKPTFVTQLREFMGTAKAAGNAIGCSSTTISMGIKNGKIAKQYELAAEALCERLTKNTEESKIVRSKSLNSSNLKDELWDTMKQVKQKKMPPPAANASAANARAILSTLHLEIRLQKTAGLSKGLKEFSDA